MEVIFPQYHIVRVLRRLISTISEIQGRKGLVTLELEKIRQTTISQLQRNKETSSTQKVPHFHCSRTTNPQLLMASPRSMRRHCQKATDHASQVEPSLLLSYENPLLSTMTPQRQTQQTKARTMTALQYTVVLCRRVSMDLGCPIFQQIW